MEIKPLDPRLLKTAKAARWFIAGVVALALLTAAATVGFTSLLSQAIANIFAANRGTRPLEVIGLALVLLLGVGLVRAAITWVQEWLSALAASRAKSQLRGRLLDAITGLGSKWLANRNTAELGLMATANLEALDSYFAKFLPQLVATALVTPLLTLLVFRLDFLSGVAVICTLPLIPLFMIFIGWATQNTQQNQLRELNRMARHFGEVMRGLTTLRVFGRLSRQPAQISQTSDRYRVQTMKVLRVSFLSGFALEVAASLSVALIAVSIGLRLIDGSLSLQTGLWVLLLAPEIYLPLRLVGANFHASTEGVAAASAILDTIDDAASQSQNQTERAALPDVQPGHVLQVTGASGSGKTSALNRIRESLDPMRVAWLPQRTTLLPGTVLQNIVGPTQNWDNLALERALTLAAVGSVDLGLQVSDSSLGVSGGQAQRIALARVFYRCLTQPVEWLILDEPVSALDTERSAAVDEAIGQLARQLRVVVASHQPLRSVTRMVGVADA